MTDPEILTRLEELEAELRRLRAQLVEPAPATAGAPVSRRSVLGKLGGAAVAGIAAAGAGGVVAAQPAAAAAGDTMKLGASMDAGTAVTSVAANNPSAALQGRNTRTSVYFNPGLRGISTTGAGVMGSDGSSVTFRTTYRGGVVGGSDSNFGVVGSSYRGSSTGVYGVSGTGLPPSQVGGVVGNSDRNAGVVGLSAAEDRAAGEFVNSGEGRGATFKSVRAAQVRLIPSDAATHPPSGFAGDLFLDASKRLWLCKSGTTWVQVA